MSTSLCRPLAELRATDLPIAGGKGANLGELMAGGFDVPDGFVVTTEAYRRAVGLGERRQADVRSVPVPDDLAAAVTAAYAALGGGPVAVRSSATAEDLPGAAFAGQQDTYLGVVGDAQVLDAVRDCWASLWTERAIAYRDRLGIDPDAVTMAVVVQRMVEAEVAGVMFTADPVTGARDRVVIDASPGLGEAVVAGLVTPDHLVLDADDRIVERTAGRREVIVRSRAGGGTETSPGGTASEPTLSDYRARALARVGRRVAAHFGRPQDIEWALQGGRIAVVQARPMTALPPPPRRLDPVQRLVGPVILELLPRRPYPMELTVWIDLVGRHVHDLLAGMVGGRIDFGEVILTRDSVMTEYVPPAPRPTVRTPLKLLGSLTRAGRDPGGWRHDPRRVTYLAGITGLNRLDVGSAAWPDLLAVPGTAARLSTLMTALRIDYLPPAAAAMVRLRVLLALLHRGELFAALLLQLPTETSRANDELTALASGLRALPDLAARLVGLDAGRALDLLRAAPEAAELTARLDAFLNRYGHRETGSILLLREPSWAAAPETVLALLQVLLAEAPRTATPPFDAALQRLLQHPVVRRTRGAERVRRLVRKASSAVQVREDTHFELSRPMPAVRRAVIEVGRRLAAAGALAQADDVWYLSWDEVLAQPDPASDPAGDRLRAAVRRRRTAMAELAGSPLIATATLYPHSDDADALVTGVGGGGGSVEGAVRLIAGPAGFGELKAGEVLVCPATNPSWTPLFTRAAAVVVDHGGLASHAAIVAREYGIPAVMGTGNGTTVLATGTRVRVDGDRGRVTPAG